MDLKLKGRRALVTGSTAGIGFAIARTLAAEGVSVVVTGRTQARVDKALAELRAAVPDARFEGFAGDLAEPGPADDLTQEFPDIDILVNNLGMFEPRAFAGISDPQWQKMIETNFFSGLRLSRFYLPRMLERNWGRVLFISSESALDVPAEMIHYGVTKTMQLALARGMAKLCAGTAVTVNALMPGPTRSEGIIQFVADIARERGVDAATAEREFFTDTRPNSLLGRFASTEEIAAFCVYLASPLAAATNGATLRCDGGIINSIV